MGGRCRCTTNLVVIGEKRLEAVKKLIKEINQKSSAPVGAVSCVCEYTESVTSKAKHR